MTDRLKKLGWRALVDEAPREGDVVIATDGEARWMDAYYPQIVTSLTWYGVKRHIATHWFPLPPIKL